MSLVASWSAAIQRAVTPAVCAALRANGYAVADNVFGPAMIAALRDELTAVQHRMHANCTHLVKVCGRLSCFTFDSGAVSTQVRNRMLLAMPLASLSDGSVEPGSRSLPSQDNAVELLEKAHIFEAELSLDSAIRGACPQLAGVDDDTSLMTMINLFMPQLGLDSQACNAAAVVLSCDVSAFERSTCLRSTAALLLDIDCPICCNQHVLFRKSPYSGSYIQARQPA